MGQKARAFDALCTAITTDNGVELAQRDYDRVVREYALSALDEEYGVIRSALDDCAEDAAAARLILRWCEDVNTRVLTPDE